MTSVLESRLPLLLLSSLYLCPNFLGGMGVDEQWGIPFEQVRLCVAGGGRVVGEGKGELNSEEKKEKRARDLRQFPYGTDFFSRLPHSINIRLIHRTSFSPPANLSFVCSI